MSMREIKIQYSLESRKSAAFHLVTQTQKKKLIVMIFFFFRDVTRAVTRGRRLTMEEEWDEFVDEVVQVRNLRTRPGCPDPRTALTMGVCADWRA